MLLWCDWGKLPRIEQVDMDGKNRKVLVNSDLGWPNALSIDFTANTIYWTDAKKKSIEACDLSGHNRRLVLNALSHPYGVTVLDGYLYWTDWETKSLQRADKNTGLDRSTIRSALGNLMDVKAWKVWIDRPDAILPQISMCFLFFFLFFLIHRIGIRPG